MKKQLNVFTRNDTLVGLLEYIPNEEIFKFKYDSDFVGFEFGEINIKNGREFESTSMFGLFAIDESYGRNVLAEKHNLSNLDSNKTQWYILENFINEKNPNKSFYFAKLNLHSQGDRSGFCVTTDSH